jgi:hypothetical protein
MSYRTSLINHLGSYKKKQLAIDEPGLFRYRGEDVKRDHVLPVAQKWANLLPAGQDVIRAYLNRHPRITLHTYFHHLTSSQAFAFNLFIPFFEGGRDSSRSLIRAFGQHGDLVDWKPEAIPDDTEGTNLDAWWRLQSSMETFCEVKLCEGGFGKGVVDARHLEKLRSIYGPRLRNHVASELLLEENFFPNYQVLRNIWHLVGSENAELIFLMPRANGRLWKQLDEVLVKVDSSVRTKVRAVAIESLLDDLSTDPSCPPALVALAGQLRDKYVPASA